MQLSAYDINSHLKFQSMFTIALFNLTSIILMRCGETVTKAFLISFKSTARILMSAGYDSNLNDLFQALGWRKLCQQRLDKKFIMMHKPLNGMTPEYLRSCFVFRDNLNSYHLRNTENTLTLPQPRTDYPKRSFSYSGAQLWNGILLELRQATS